MGKNLTSLMRSSATFLMGVACVLAACPTRAESIGTEVVSNFEKLYALKKEEEWKKNVLALPESIKEVLRYKGIPFYETPSRPFAGSEIEFLKSCLDRLPDKFLTMPAKGIVAYSKELHLFSFPTTVAKASGPYIIVGNRLFKNKKLSSNEKLSVFMHEYAHVVQYYHLNGQGSVRTMRNHSSLVFDFAVKMGWQVRNPENRDDWLTGDAITYANNKMISWDLPKEREQETTDYGKRNPVEDQAETFGWVLAGHPEMVSEQRVRYAQEFLDEPLDRFLQGVVPWHPKSKKIGRLVGNVSSLFKKQAGSEQVKGSPKPWLRGMDKDDPTPVQEIADYYKAEFLKRGFEIAKPFETKALKLQEDYASAVYAYKEDKLLIQIIGFKNAANYLVKPGILIRVTEGVEL